MKQQLETAIAGYIKRLFGTDTTIELTRPDENFGDYATNAALQLAKPLGRSAREIAEDLAQQLRIDMADQVTEITVAGPGFINLRLRDAVLRQAAAKRHILQAYSGQQVLVEFGDPNPFKAMHLGHLYTTIAGDAIARLFEVAGANVKRLSYHGDIGRHVAMAIWAIGQQIDWDVSRLAELETEVVTIDNRPLTIKTVMGYLYAKGAKAFAEDDAVADSIRAVNASVYARDRDDVNAIYDWGVARSFSYFDIIFTELGVQYDQRYLESQTAPIGVASVREHLGTVFQESQGAIIYPGEKVGLHTRVFINSKGLPTYEAKDLGLAELKNQDYPQATQSIIITATEQTEYFRVMLAALGEFKPQLAAKTHHIAHGFLSLTTGKMSSRSGKVYSAQDLLDATSDAVTAAYPGSAADVQRDAYLAAIKYTFLRNRIGGDIIFSVEDSVALEGNSGPYLQYAHARARSLLAKAAQAHAVVESTTTAASALSLFDSGVEPAERSLLRKITEYPEVVDAAVRELMPHYICSYLYELAQCFNSFYEHNRVIGDPRASQRLALIQAYADTLVTGLTLLGIPAPVSM